MEDVLKEPIQLSKGINLKELFTSQTEFHIDIDFKKKRPDSYLNMNNDLLLDTDEEDESDTDDILKNIESSTEQMMLSSPEYHSFKDLAAKMIDCVPTGDVKMLIIEEGDGPLIPGDAEVTLHYAAYWEKAKIPFDSTLTMNFGMPLKIRLGTGSVLLGLEIGLTAVKGPKARFHLLLQPKVAWGEKGAPPRVRPEPALFVIVLYDVRDTQAGNRFNDLPMEEQKKFEVTMRTVKSLHAQAKDFFNKRKYKKAIQNYQQSLSVLRISQPKDETEENEVKKLKIVVFVNLAVCYYKIEKPKYVINMCENLDEIIDINTHCKALFYYGRAHEMLGKREEALKYYNKALKLEPKNKDIGKALVDFERYVQESSKKEKEMWQNAFKATPQKKTNVVYDVDDEFQNGVREMCQSLVETEGCAQFELPTGLTRNELDFLKTLVTEFDGLIVDEEGEGKRKRVTVVKQP
ncbi:PREDICTED: inactive peptidyl-prolyl cis-trans isomerase shutdown isoform X1 [Papilio polytes]|uniref:inactive peptidyl-prolyl cis-trans isomerase shutdown isoform X1 n=1 Tax=Papilio polytes TaxID=76194 RepID=UPI0006767D3A|nr:PREDICTED: inactive peptidyl-prolyl cis-trans isomerase shutdown isoform X1 [Papilio polytes]